MGQIPHTKQSRTELGGADMTKRTCLCCGDEFTGHVNKKHCSTKCKIAYGNQLRKAKGTRKDKKVAPELRRQRRIRDRANQKDRGLCKHCAQPSTHGVLCERHRSKAIALEKPSKYRQRYGVYAECRKLSNEIIERTRKNERPNC